MTAWTHTSQGTATSGIVMMATARAPPSHGWLRIGVGGNRLGRTEGFIDLPTDGIDCTEEACRRLQDAEESLQERHEPVD